MNKTDNGKEQFFEEFKARFGETVTSIEMVNILAGSRVFSELGLKPEGGDIIWGLLVFCESKKVYFYVHPSESMMGAMMRVASQGEGPKEQFVCLTDVKGFELVAHKRHWFDFLLPNAKFKIMAQLDCGNEKLVFEINTQNKAEQVRAKF
ncbi:hypothetical protein [Treponema sp.]|uniref:hypothetical protein n=1 Tax=Treponema sp. TaxID=166 RepID=UPI00298E3B08|nr:hypothetical protein [Treponema sp.]MCR5612903.1 hypothetical protein [Treponema sp.]